MKKRELIKYFGSARVAAEKLGITSQAIYLWNDTVPEAQAWRAQHVSDGALTFDWKADYLDKNIRSGPQNKAAA